MIDEGYIKFKCIWNRNKLPVKVPYDLIYFRNKLYNLKYIGFNKKLNVSYGNISFKIDSKRFIITGSQTAIIKKIKDRHFSLVIDYDIKKNLVQCSGEVKASSESLSHAAVYESDNKIMCVIHIHNNKLWNKWKYTYPSVDEKISYGTVEMAYAIKDIVKNNKTNIIVMKGHKDGIIVYGENIKNTFKKLIDPE